MSAIDLLDILLAGDFNPTLRADLPAAVRSALHGDARPILRLAGAGELQRHRRASDDDLRGAVRRRRSARRAPSRGTAATRRRCAPTRRSARPARIPRTHLGPFDARIALLSDTIPLCVSWPNASAAPVAAGTAAERADARDRRRRRPPHAGHRRRARSPLRIPGAQFLAVPFVGHSVIGADTTGCARAGVAAFFAGQTVQPCTATAPQFPPTRIAPTRLAQVPGAGSERKAANAAAETLQDVGEVFLGIAADRRKPPRVGTQIGGLRSGTARWTATGIRLRRVQYVPGVLVSGFAPRSRQATTTVTVSGDGAPHGTRAHPPRRRRSSAASAAAG